MMMAVWILVGVGAVLGLLGCGAFCVCRSIEGSEELMNMITDGFMQEDPEIGRFEAECMVITAMEFLKKLGTLAICLFAACVIGVLTLLAIDICIL